MTNSAPEDPTIPTPRPRPSAPAPELGGLDPQIMFHVGLNTGDQRGGATDWEPPSPAHLAELLPQFQIEALLGRGGMGAVYKGRQITLDRPVAIKLLPAEVAADPDFIARFQREARTLARLQHPGIVAVYEFGQTREEHLFFVMEFVGGTDLLQLIRGPGLTPAQTLEIIAQICEALNYAHGQGVMHRDIKPANVLITKEGRAKLADFGLARPVEEDTASITRPSIVMGTVGYMAPEQRTGVADHRADIFSLGVMLYEMLTGRTPEGIFDPPSKTMHVDVRLDEVVVKALQQLPERRYQQASEMKTDVDHIRTTPQRIAPPAEIPQRKSKTPLVAGIMGAVVIIALAGFYISRKKETGAPLETAAVPSSVATPAVGASFRTVSIPGLPDLPPLMIPPGEPGLVKEMALPGAAFARELQLLPDDRRLLVLRDRNIALMDLEIETLVWNIPGSSPQSMDVSKDGSRFVTYELQSADGKSTDQRQATQAQIILRETRDGHALQSWTIPTTPMGVNNTQVALSPSGKRVVARIGGITRGDLHSEALFAALEEGKDEPIARWSAPNHHGHQTSCVDENTFFSTGNGDPVLLRINQPGGAEYLLPDRAEIRNAISPDKKIVVATLQASGVGVWDLATRKRLGFLEKASLSPTKLVFAGNDLIVDVEQNNAPKFQAKHLEVWDRATYALLGRFQVPKADQFFVNSLAGAANGSFAVVRVKFDPDPKGGDPNHIQIWRLPKPGQTHVSAKGP